MKSNEKSIDEIYLALREEISATSGKFIFLKTLLATAESISDDMPAFLQSQLGKAVFYNAVSNLITEGKLSEVGDKPYTINGLYLKYRINKEAVKQDPGLVSQIVRSIVPPATVDYYIKNPKDFLNDRAIIDTLCNFLRQDSMDPVTVNERAYILFGDEKFFRGAGKERSRGEVVLKRLGLGYSDLGCRETIEPFFSFHKHDFHSSQSRNIYMIENKDTFWSFKRTAMDSPSIFKPDMLIYGEGKKIISSFRFVDEYAVDAAKDKFFYFGDLDAEGVNIFCELLDEYPKYQITPFVDGYSAIWEIGRRHSPTQTPKQQRINNEKIDRFIRMLDQSWATELKAFLEDGFYIPQEALSAAEMRERFGMNLNA